MEFIIPIALILVGLGLIAVEVYVMPGVNVVGVAGAAAVLGGVIYAFIEAGGVGGLVATVGALSLGGAMFYVMWRSGAWDRFVLATDLRPDADEAAREAEARSRYLGRSGVAVTPLRPSGIVEIDGDRVEVQTEGEFIAAGSEVKVVAMDRRRYFVRLAGSPGTETAVPVRPDASGTGS